jgi:hypothetical protein
VVALVGGLVAGGIAQPGVSIIATYSAQVELQKAMARAEDGRVEVVSVGHCSEELA